MWITIFPLQQSNIWQHVKHVGPTKVGPMEKLTLCRRGLQMLAKQSTQRTLDQRSSLTNIGPLGFDWLGQRSANVRPTFGQHVLPTLARWKTSLVNIGPTNRLTLCLTLACFLPICPRSSVQVAHKAACSALFPCSLPCSWPCTGLASFQDLHPSCVLSFSTVRLQVVLGRPTFPLPPCPQEPMSLLSCSGSYLPFVEHDRSTFLSSSLHFLTDSC